MRHRALWRSERSGISFSSLLRVGWNCCSAQPVGSGQVLRAPVVMDRFSSDRSPPPFTSHISGAWGQLIWLSLHASMLLFRRPWIDLLDRAIKIRVRIMSFKMRLVRMSYWLNCRRIIWLWWTTGLKSVHTDTFRGFPQTKLNAGIVP